MITRPRTRPQTLLQAFVKPCPSYARHQRRYKHIPPPLAHQQSFAKNGVPGFVSSKTYDETWVKYMQYLCDQLNTMTQGTADESIGVKDLHTKYAHDSSQAALYNYAAMAHHTHFFWEFLADKQTEPARKFRSDIEEHFDSLEHLRNEMLETADAMFGNGFVWLMRDMSHTKALRVLATYNAGSPFPEAHARRQSTDMATNAPNMPGSVNSLSRKLTQVQNTAGFIGDNSPYRARNYMGALLARPILCINVWQHMYIPDYGVTGKRAYLSAWWDRINWDRVLQEYNEIPDWYGDDKYRGMVRGNDSLGRAVDRAMARL